MPSRICLSLSSRSMRFFFLLILRPPSSTLFPYTTLFRSDLGVPLVGVGLLYTRGYFDQRLRLDGWQGDADETLDRKSTRLNSSHRTISYAVFCLKKKRTLTHSRTSRTMRNGSAYPGRTIT